MEQPPLWDDDPTKGETLRDKGIGRVLSTDKVATWRADAEAWVATLPPGQRITSETLITAVGMPPSPRAVGAFIRTAAMAGWLTPTGEIVQNTRPSRHAGIVRVWVVA
jgi:hypothetical protein